MTSTTFTYLVVGAFVIYAVRIIVATVRNAPVRDDFEPTSCPPIDADTVLRKHLEDDRADWPDEINGCVLTLERVERWVREAQ